jgi:hypothetical protein
LYRSKITKPIYTQIFVIANFSSLKQKFEGIVKSLLNTIHLLLIYSNNGQEFDLGLSLRNHTHTPHLAASAVLRGAAGDARTVQVKSL